MNYSLNFLNESTNFFYSASLLMYFLLLFAIIFTAFSVFRPIYLKFYAILAFGISLFVVVFYLLIPINFFYISRVEYLNSKISLYNQLNFKVASAFVESSTVRIDDYKFGNTQNRKRLVLDYAGRCYYSQIIQTKQLDSFLNSTSIKLTENLDCEPSSVVENNIWNLRLIIGFVASIFLIHFSSLTDIKKIKTSKS